MKHTIEYNGERKTVDAPRTATINGVLEIAFPRLSWPVDYTKVVCVGTGKRGAAVCILGPYHDTCACPSCASKANSERPADWMYHAMTCAHRQFGADRGPCDCGVAL